MRRTGHLKSLEGTAKLRIHTAVRKARFDATLLCERPARVRLEVTDFLDHLIFLVLIRNDLLMTYSVPENLFARGRAVPEQVQAFLGVPLDVEDLVSLILGSPFFVPLKSPELDVSFDGGMVLLKATELARGLSYKVRVDRYWRPVESLLEQKCPGKGMRQRIRVEFQKYRQIDSLDFPFRIRVTDERSGWYSVIHFQSLSLNPDLPEDLFEFTPPKDADTVEFH